MLPHQALIQVALRETDTERMRTGEFSLCNYLVNGEVNFITWTHVSTIIHTPVHAKIVTLLQNLSHGVNIRGKTQGYNVTAKYLQSAILSQHDYKRKTKPDFSRAFKGSFIFPGLLI